jgi:hypothetical protein
VAGDFDSAEDPKLDPTTLQRTKVEPGRFQEVQGSTIGMHE